MIVRQSLLMLSVLLIANTCVAEGQSTLQNFRFNELPALPDKLGVSGAFAGDCQGVLIVAGGSNFPNRPPWDGGERAISNRVYSLESSEGEWKTIASLPRPMFNGVSVTTPHGVVCVGGEDPKQALREAFLFSLADGQITTKPLPALPVPVARACGALVGSDVYVVGGVHASDSVTASKRVWRLSMPSADAWQEIESLPGDGRILAVAGAVDDDLFVFSGANLYKTDTGTTTRKFLRDAYRYRKDEGWKRLADLPCSVTAAPSPAATVGTSRLLIFGGDDGSRFEHPQPPHPGFSKSILAYDTSNNTWTNLGDAPFSQVVTPLFWWQGSLVIPSGEVRPSVRSVEVRQIFVEPNATAGDAK